MTWGQETSLSEYSYCQHVIFAGVLHRDQLEIASAVLGQRDELYGLLPASTIKEVINSEIAHGLYQAISRGCCRMVDGNQALSMDVWLIHGNDDIRPMLEQMMPGLQWLSWKPKHLDNRHKLLAASTAIEGYLDQLPMTVTTMANQTLRKAVGTVVSRNYFRESLKMAVANLEDWALVGRRIDRLEPDYVAEFWEAA